MSDAVRAALPVDSRGVADESVTAPIPTMPPDPEVIEPSVAVAVGALACAAVERWARVEHGRPYTRAWLATSFLADVVRTPWLGDWWLLYQAIAQRHHAAITNPGH